MKAALLAGLCAVTAQAAQLKRQTTSSSSSCNMTSVVTASSGTETYTEYEDTYAMHATTTVTVLSLGASPLATTATPTPVPSNSKRSLPHALPTPQAKRQWNPPPGSFNAKRDLEVRAVCQSPTSTYTTTVGAETITITSTNTLSRFARATATAPACDANKNYGLINGTLNRNFLFGYGEFPNYQQYSNLTTEDCCKKCFTSTDGCVAWSYGGTVNNTMPVEGCVMAMYSGGCPTRWGADTIVYKNDNKYPVGMGACNVQVAYFQG